MPFYQSCMKKLFLLLHLMLFVIINANSQNNLPSVYEIKTDTAIIQVLSNTYWQLLEEHGNKWTIADLNKSSLANQFHDSLSKATDTTVNTYWFRYRLKNVMTYDAKIALDATADQVDFYVSDSNGKWSHFVTGYKYPWSKKDGLKNGNYIPLTIKPEQELLIYERINNGVPGIPQTHKIDIVCTEKVTQLELSQYDSVYQNKINSWMYYLGAIYFGIILFAACFNFFFFLIAREKEYLLFALSLLFLFAVNNPLFSEILRSQQQWLADAISGLGVLSLFFFLLFIRYYFKTFKHTPRLDKVLFVVTCAFLYLPVTAELQIAFHHVHFYTFINSVSLIIAVAAVITLLLTVAFYSFITGDGNKLFLVAILPFVSIFGITLLFIAINITFNLHFTNARTVIQKWTNLVASISWIWMVCIFSWILFMRYEKQKKEIALQTVDKERLAKEKEIERSQLIEQQKFELEKTVEDRTFELKQSLQNLQSAQKQLIQSEKMASLGELTAGIAHEIQNPLNFVNNFSEVNKEMLLEMKHELKKGNIDDANAIADDIIGNEEKINHHGKRADAIVKGMLQHSRSNTGQKEPSDINALADEYLRLTYHGLRAKDNSLNAKLNTDFDASIGEIDINSQDLGRLLLNLYNNAFYAVAEKKKSAEAGYAPIVSVSTKKTGDMIEIQVKDNGNGIPQTVIDKIFQPFFTTKPTGQGTGLGLSLSYDIVKAHGGEIKVETKEGEGTAFIVQLPISM
jgi:two-component system, NtrC family, sensor kinase